MDVVITAKGKKIPILEEVGDFIYKIVKEQFLIFCFYIEREESNNIKKYVPKYNEEDGVEMFFVNEKFSCISYLFIIIERKKYKEKIKEVVNDIEDLKLNIKGRRHFNGFSPELLNNEIKDNMKVIKYPFQ